MRTTIKAVRSTGSIRLSWLVPNYIHKFADYDEIVKSNLSQISNIAIDTIEIEDNPHGENNGITYSIQRAANCYCLSIHEACILFASIAAECIINWDSRMQSERQKAKYNWLDLDEGNLRDALREGLPINELLSEDEMRDLLSHGKNSKAERPEFINLRNKAAHGEYHAISVIPYGTGFMPVHELNKSKEMFPLAIIPDPVPALRQLQRCTNFFTRWVASKPKIVLPLEITDS